MRIPDTADETEPPLAIKGAGPRLVIVDSAGKITRFAWLHAQPHWSGITVLCTEATSPAHRALLRSARVEHHVVGRERVDLRAALAWLGERYGVEHVRVDAGPTLNSELLRAGLVDEVSVLVAPQLVGTGSETGTPLYLVRALPRDAAPKLELCHVERVDHDQVWLRYNVS